MDTARDDAIASMTVFCEASSLTQQARVGVAHAVRNRVALGRWGKTAAAVCLKRMQFSEWNADKVDNANLLRAAEVDDQNTVWLLCQLAWTDSTFLPDPTDGATHFYDTSISPPTWTLGATFTVQIDSLRFYRDVK